MTSMLGTFCCFDCGEFAKATLYDINEESEIHMCNVTQLKDKKQKLLKLRDMIDEEIAKCGPQSTAPPLLPPLPSLPDSQPTSKIPPKRGK